MDNQQTPTVMSQLCAFMEVNDIHYIETKSKKSHYGITTVIEAHTYVDEDEQDDE